MPAPYSPLEVPRVLVALGGGREDAVALLEAVPELAHVAVAVVEERRAVAALQPVRPAAHVHAGLAEERPDA